jgi:hypothetical protein
LRYQNLVGRITAFKRGIDVVTNQAIIAGITDGTATAAAAAPAMTAAGPPP